MKINITKKEYRKLLDLLYLGDWMINSSSVPDDRDSSYLPIIEKFYALAKEFDCEELIVYYPKEKEHFPTREMEDGLFSTVVDHYNDTTFWQELIGRLADRDFARIPGCEEMDDEQRIDVIIDLEQKYAEEFATSGLDTLELLKSSHHHKDGKK